MEEIGKKINLKKNFIYNLISQIFSMIVPLITAPYLARVLLEEGNGRYSFTYSIITYFILFSSLGFNIYGQREISKNRDNITAQKRIFLEISIIRCIFTLISLTALFAFLFFVGFGEKYNTLILIESINVFAVIFDFNFFYQGREDFKSLAIRNILTRIIGLITVFLFVKTSDDVWIYALCIGLNTLICNLALIPKIVNSYKGIEIGQMHLMYHLRPAFLIFLPTLAVTIYSVFDKSMIGWLASNADYENGCYEQAYKINSIALTLVTVISPIFIPRNAVDYKNQNYDGLREHMYVLSNYVWMIGTPLIVGMITLSSNLSSWFLGSGYEEVPLLLNIMSCRFLVSGFGTVFGDTFFIPIGKEKYPTIATFAAAGLNVGLNFILIPRFGALGAAITTAVSELVVTSILVGLVVHNKIVSVKKIFFMSFKYIISALIMFVPIYFINSKMSYSVVSFLICVLVGFCVYYAALILLKTNFVVRITKMVCNKISEKFNKVFDKVDEGR